MLHNGVCRRVRRGRSTSTSLEQDRSTAGTGSKRELGIHQLQPTYRLCCALHRSWLISASQCGAIRFTRQFSDCSMHWVHPRVNFSFTLISLQCFSLFFSVVRSCPDGLALWVRVLVKVRQPRFSRFTGRLGIRRVYIRRDSTHSLAPQPYIEARNNASRGFVFATPATPRYQSASAILGTRRDHCIQQLRSQHPGMPRKFRGPDVCILERGEEIPPFPNLYLIARDLVVDSYCLLDRFHYWFASSSRLLCYGTSHYQDPT